MRVIIDTNVILDALSKREPWCVEAEKIFLLAANDSIDAFITASSTTDIYYLIRKYLKNTLEAKDTMKKLFAIFAITDVVSEDCKSAIHSDIIDYEDAVISHSATRNEMNYIITRNTKDFIHSKITAIEPKEFLNMTHF